MNDKQKPRQIILRIVGFIFGLGSIFAGVSVFLQSANREPERYITSGIVTLCGGVLWVISSSVQKFHLQKKQYYAVLVILFMGLIFGLIYTFTHCGGECGGDSICHWYRGFPAYWLRISKCMATSTTTSTWDGYWKIHNLSLLADIVFWVNAGLMITFVWNLSTQNFN